MYTAHTPAALKPLVKAVRALVALETERDGGDGGLQKLREEFRQLHGQIDGGTVKDSEKFNDNLARLQAATGGLARQLAEVLLPTLNSVTLTSAGGESPALIGRIRERLAAQTAELETGRALTEQEKFAIKVRDDMANAKVKLTKAQRAQLGGMLNESAAAAQALTAQTRQLALDTMLFEHHERSEQADAEVQSSQGREQYRVALAAQTSALAFVYRRVVGDVACNLGVSTQTVLAGMADGKFFVGEQAVRAGLADAMLSREQLLAKLSAAAAGEAVMYAERRRP